MKYESIVSSDGKYETILSEDYKDFFVSRYGERWRDLTGDGYVLSLFFRIKELEEMLERNTNDL